MKEEYLKVIQLNLSKQEMKAKQKDISFIIGKTFGELTVLSLARIDKKYHKYVKCKCSCGYIGEFSADSIKRGQKTCGKHKTRLLIGKTFGEITVLSISKSDKHRRRFMKCICSCGKELYLSASSLLRAEARKKCIGHPATSVALRKVTFQLEGGLLDRFKAKVKMIDSTKGKVLSNLIESWIKE